MTTPSSGEINVQHVNSELGYSTTRGLNMSDAAVRNLAGKASGNINFSDLRGKSNGYIHKTGTAYANAYTGGEDGYNGSMRINNKYLAVYSLSDDNKIEIYTHGSNGALTRKGQVYLYSNNDWQNYYDDYGGDSFGYMFDWLDDDTIVVGFYEARDSNEYEHGALFLYRYVSSEWRIVDCYVNHSMYTLGRGVACGGGKIFVLDGNENIRVFSVSGDSLVYNGYFRPSGPDFNSMLYANDDILLFAGSYGDIYAFYHGTTNGGSVSSAWDFSLDDGYRSTASLSNDIAVFGDPGYDDNVTIVELNNGAMVTSELFSLGAGGGRYVAALNDQAIVMNDSFQSYTIYKNGSTWTTLTGAKAAISNQYIAYGRNVITAAANEDAFYYIGGIDDGEYTNQHIIIMPISLV